MKTVQLKEQIKRFPAKPGIYLFKGSKNKPLYIGKALNLKNRVSHYLKTDDPRLKKMIEESNKVDFIETKNDIEALILESQYIKKYQPDFNIMLRDDKQYFFVGFSNDNFPRIFLTHQIQDTKYKILNTDFIGPFTDGLALKVTLRLLRKVFPYCTCKQPHSNYCLNYHIGKCPGFCCCPKDSPERSRGIAMYHKNIKAIKDVLSGKKESLIKGFEKDMHKLGKEHRFEEAIELQYKIEKLKRIFQNSIIIQDVKYRILDKETGINKEILEQLSKAIGLSHLPRRIECYDIANIQGKHAVGAMVVFTNGKPDKNEYRKFKIQRILSSEASREGGYGDTQMLEEILTRRLNHPEWHKPDLIIVDGGKQQLRAAEVAISKSQITNHKQIPIIALTKNEKHMGHKIILENGKEISLSKLPLNIKNLLLQIDSEAHRFAISYYRKMHRQSIK